MGVLPVSGTAFVLYDGPEHPETEPSHFSQKFLEVIAQAENTWFTNVRTFAKLPGMCRQITCKSCGKASWAGCGMHVEQVLGHLPESDRCSCSSHAPTSGRKRRWFSRA